MRGSGSAPAATARRSAHEPAQKTALVASSSPSPWRSRIEREPALVARTSQPVTTSPPAARKSSAKARATAPKSTIPVCGECRAATPAACGSISPIPSASTRRRPATPFALPRRSSSSRPAHLGVGGGDDQLAAALEGDAAGFAVLVHGGGASHAELGLQRARRVVDAGVDDSRVVAGLVGPDRRLALEHANRRAAGRRALSSRATARPRIPPPTTAMSHLSATNARIRYFDARTRDRDRLLDGGAGAAPHLPAHPAGEPLHGGRDAGPRRRQREHRRHPGDGPRGVPRGEAARARLELRLLHRQQHRPARGRGPLRPRPQPRHRDLPGLARPHDGADGGRSRDRDVELPARAARRQPRPRRQTLLPDPARLARALRSASASGSARASASTGRRSWASTSWATSTPSTAPTC